MPFAINCVQFIMKLRSILLLLAAQDANPLSAGVKRAYLRMKGLVPPSTQGR
jgi:hypothetical protein